MERAPLTDAEFAEMLRKAGCSCGAETPCEPEDMRLGAVFQCPECRNIFGCSWMVGDPDEGTQSLVPLKAVLDGEVEIHSAVKAFGGNFVIGQH